MGEIGFPRREFLHELRWWEVQSIIRGYNARHHAGWEQARLVAYNAHYAMGVPKGHSIPLVNEWVKFPWEHKAEPAEILTEEDRKQMQSEIDWINEQFQEQRNKQQST